MKVFDLKNIFIGPFLIEKVNKFMAMILKKLHFQKHHKL